jgi:hypothetical protein
MGGPALYPGHLLNVYTGRADQGPLRVVVRADPRVRLRLQSERGERCEMLVSARDQSVGMNLFAILLPWTTDVTSMQGLDDDGQVLTTVAVRTAWRQGPRLPGGHEGGLHAERAWLEFTAEVPDRGEVLREDRQRPVPQVDNLGVEGLVLGHLPREPREDQVGGPGGARAADDDKQFRQVMPLQDALHGR